MRILMIAPEPVLEPRGTPISVYQRLQALSSLGHTVDLLTYHLGADISLPGVAVHRVPRVRFIRQIKIGPSWPKILLDLMLLLKAVGMLARRKYDVIHSHEEAAFFSMALAGCFRTPHLYDMHSSLPLQLSRSTFGQARGVGRPLVSAFAALERRVLDSCDALITVGADLEQHARKVSGQARPVTIENSAIDLPQTTATSSAAGLRSQFGMEGKLLVVYAGSFEHYQGLELLLDSAVILQERCPDAAFVLLGGRPEQIAEYQQKARERKLEGVVHFLGPVSPEEAPAYLETAAVLVSPRVAGMSVPLKLYGYLRAGKPIVATRILAHTQVLSEENAVLVEPTREALAQGLMNLLENPPLRRELGERAQQLFRAQYDFPSYMAKVDQVYRGLRTATAGSGNGGGVE
jgi:glycosyltransferase involved in cell wall biosynthesis